MSNDVHSQYVLRYYIGGVIWSELFSEERAHTYLNFTNIISIAVKYIFEVCLYTKLRVLFHLINFVLAENQF